IQPVDRTPPRQAPPPKSAGEFTRFFGKVDLAGPTPVPVRRPEAAPLDPPLEAVDTPTQIMAPPKVAPRPAYPTPPPSRPASAPAPSDGGGGFTAIFGRIGEARL